MKHKRRTNPSVRNRKKGRLLVAYLEKASSDLLELVRDKFEERFRGQAGIYALYKGSEPYYIGLASDLGGRIKSHMKDRHARKWDRFNVYIVRRKTYMKDLESLVLHLAQPKGNRTRGRLNAESLKPFFKKELKTWERSIEQAL
jgi:hypothetical protein